jgi:hypothetical protein
MEAILVSSVVFFVVFGGALAGMGLRQVLPQNQLGAEVKDVIRLSTGLLVTMTALVLGMLVSTANSSYQERKNQLAEMGSNFVLVDGLLASYGPEARNLREDLRGMAQKGVDRVWPTSASGLQLRPNDNGQSFYDRLRNLAPKDDSQVAIKSAAISAAVNLRHTYWLMFIGTEQSSLSFPLLLVVVTWLTFIFISFGLFAPGTKAVFVTMVACALAVSGAVFIIMAMYTPFSGVMRISSSPLRDALSLMGH